MINLLLKPLGAIVQPRERELEAVAAAAALESEIGQVPRLPGILAAVVEEVPRAGAVGGSQGARIRYQEVGAGGGHVHHLVRVDGDGVGEVRSLELVAVFGGEDDWAAPAGVNVQPHAKLLADGGDFGKRLVGAADGGARGGIDVERRLALLFGLGDEVAEGRGAHAAVVIDGDGPDTVTAKTADHGALLDRVVAVGAGEDDKVVGGSDALCLGVRVEGVAGDDKRGQVAGAAALAGDAAGKVAGEAKEVGQGSAGGLFNDGKGGRDLVDVKLRNSVSRWVFGLKKGKMQVTFVLSMDKIKSDMTPTCFTCQYKHTNYESW